MMMMIILGRDSSPNSYLVLQIETVSRVRELLGIQIRIIGIDSFPVESEEHGSR